MGTNPPGEIPVSPAPGDTAWAGLDWLIPRGPFQPIHPGIVTPGAVRVQLSQSRWWGAGPVLSIT